ncbi:MAG: hypothetical protein PHG00_14890 [Methylococcales bacterium]|nr:hypothetical protein [Methylococcales bacterium]
MLSMFDKLSSRTLQLAKEVAERRKTEQKSQDALNRFQKIASQVPGMVFNFSFFLMDIQPCILMIWIISKLSLAYQRET